MYCSVQNVKDLLPEPITVGDTNIGTPSPGRPSTTNRSKLTPDEIISYIRFASQQIDARLRPYYVCPLRRIKSYETEILENVSGGSNIEIKVNDTGAFAKGQIIRLQGKYAMETDEIKSVKNMQTLIISQVKNDYSIEGGKISVLEFPDPIPVLAARLAISYAFDQLFSAEQSPNISEYGKEQRRLAGNDMDSILSGTIFLFGQDHTGKRFARGSLFDAFQNPTPDFQFGREKA